MNKNNRIPEIDIMRAIAIILMIIFHVAVDMKDFFWYPVNYETGIISVIGKLSAYIFIFVSGVSTTLSKNSLKNALYVHLSGLLVITVTFFFIPNSYVIWGVLQFLGTCMIIYYFIKKLKPAYFIVFSTISFVLGIYFNKLDVNFNYLIPIGITSKFFTTVDYYPLFPYISIFFIGNFIGKTVYKNKTAYFKINLNGNSYGIKFLKIFSLISKNSLIIYLIHQPAIYFVLWVIMYFKNI